MNQFIKNVDLGPEKESLMSYCLRSSQACHVSIVRCKSLAEISTGKDRWIHAHTICLMCFHSTSKIESKDTGRRCWDQISVWRSNFSRDCSGKCMFFRRNGMFRKFGVLIYSHPNCIQSLVRACEHLTDSQYDHVSELFRFSSSPGPTPAPRIFIVQSLKLAHIGDSPDIAPASIQHTANRGAALIVRLWP